MKRLFLAVLTILSCTSLQSMQHLTVEEITEELNSYIATINLELFNAAAVIARITNPTKANKNRKKYLDLAEKDLSDMFTFLFQYSNVLTNYPYYKKQYDELSKKYTKARENPYYYKELVEEENKDNDTE